VLPAEQVEAMTAIAEQGDAIFTVDLPRQEIAVSDGYTIAFEVDPFRKACLLGGLDDIGLTLRKADKIAAFEARQRSERPWLSL
jgi:3-isopropylmalate/(R)-2-methylmalate dehydratase small subunit